MGTVIRSRGFDSIKLYKDQLHHLFPRHSSTPFILSSVIKSCCVSQMHKSLGFQLHCDALKNGYDSECTLSNSLLSMYAKFSDVQSAHKLFDNMPERDVVTWSSIINCYIQNGFLIESLKLFKDMYSYGLVPKPELIACVISTCVQMGDFAFGKLIHGLVTVDERIEKSVFLSAAIMDLYFKCDDHITAYRVFDSMEIRNEFSWTSMIGGCVEVDDYERAFECLRSMQMNNLKPNRVTLISILPSCAKFSLVKEAKSIHGYAIRNEFDTDYKFSSSLIHMYCDTDIESSAPRMIFDRSTKKDVVTWSCMIGFYSRSKKSAEEAIRLFNLMQLEGIQPNDVTILAMISSCNNLLSIINGRGVHGYAIKTGLISELNTQNSFITMYAKCGFLKESVQIFTEMKVKDSVSWTAIASAYGHYGYGEDALWTFHEMQRKGMKVDAIAILEIITACNHAGLIEEGQMIFNQVIKGKNDLLINMEHYACYIDMLGRGGKLEDACDIVCEMSKMPSTRILTALVSACKIHGRFELAEKLAIRVIELDPENGANYASLSAIYAESDNWDGVMKVRKMMKERKLIKNSGVSCI